MEFGTLLVTALGDDECRSAGAARAHAHAPSTTAAARYVVRRGGVTVRVARRMLVVYDCCGGDAAAGYCRGADGVV